MSELLDKYRSSRRVNEGRTSPPLRSSLYPRLSPLNRDKYTTDWYANISSSTTGLRDKLVDEKMQHKPSSKYEFYSDSINNNASSLSDRLRSDSFPIARVGTDDRKDAVNESRRHGKNHELERLRKNLEAKYGLHSTKEETERSSRLTGSSRIIGSPIKSFNHSQGRPRSEFGRKYADLPPSKDKYRVTKPSTVSPQGSGFLSRIVNYFTSNDHNEYDDAKDSSNSDLDRLRVKKVSFHDDVGRGDIDEVDEVVSRASERERLLALENYRSLEQEHKRVLLLLEDIELEKDKLKSELNRVHDTYAAKLDEIENDLFNKTVEADKLRIDSERKYNDEFNQLKSAHEVEVSRLRNTHEKELTQLKTIHQEEVAELKNDNSKLQKKIRELDEKAFDTGFELKQVKRELDIQIRKNHEMQVEMSLRDRFRAAKLPSEEVNEYFIRSSRIEQKIDLLQKEGKNPPSKAKQFKKTESNIEENLKTLERMTRTFQFEELDDCEKYYDVAHKFLNDSAARSEEIIQQLETSDLLDPSRVLLEYMTLKRLNELSYKLCSVKELINDCKVLREFKDSDADVNDIYLRVKLEIF